MNQFPSKVRLRGKGVYGLLIIVLVASLFSGAFRTAQAAGSANVENSAAALAGVSWYVDNQATGSNSGTSWANAWRSLTAINWSLVNPGDTVYISGGTSGKTYNEGIQFNRSGASGAPITITSGAFSPYPSGHNGEVIIDGEDYCFRANGSYNTIRNITCQNARVSGIRIQGTGSIVENTVVRNNYQQGIHVHYCQSCIVRNNRVTTHDDIAQQTDGITVYDASDTIVEKNWVKITNQNNCSMCHNDGIQAAFGLGTAYRNLTIRYNYVENVKATTDNAQGIFLTEMQGEIKLIGNIIHVPIGGQAFASRRPNNVPQNVTVIGNTMKNGGYWVMRVEDDNPVIKNNIIWQTGGSSAYISNGATIRLDNRSSSAPASNIDYNLLYAPYTSNYAFNTNGSGTSLATWRANGFDAHGSFQNPNLDTCFRPTSGVAPSINRGAVLGAEYDYGLALSMCGPNGPGSFLPVQGGSRSSTGTSGWDVGAYEYGGVTTAPTATPIVPTATRIPPTATPVLPTATRIPPTATPVVPTATRAAPTATSVAPTATRVAPTATAIAPTPVGGGGSSQPFKYFLPFIDATVDQSQPQSNFGTQPILGADERPRVVSYLRFDINGLEGRAVRKATLRLYVNRKNNRYVGASSVNGGGAWTETGLTFSNAPALGQQVASAPLAASSTWVTLDVTALVRGEGLVEIALTTSGNSAAQFASREAGEFAPQLVVEL